MRKKNLLVILIILLASISADALSEDFRKNNWGDSRASVLKQAGETTQSNEDILVYEVSISSLDAVLLYNFVDDRLSSTGYLFTETHSNKNSYISDFSTIQELLIQKYGKPGGEDSVWYNELYQDDPSQYGFAVSLGHYAKQATWETERTKIIHALRGDNYEISHGISYTSKELENLADEVKDKAAMDQL